MNSHTIKQLHQLGIEAVRVQEFNSGLKLMQLVNQVFYKGDNQALSGKLRIADQQKTGNNVLNLNMILNYLKKDQKLNLPEHIRCVNTFTLLEDPSIMTTLIEWILTQFKSQKHSPPVEVRQAMSSPKEQDNQFQNFFFVSSMEKKRNVLDDSLEEENPQEQVVRKGSFKVIKPKIHTASKLPSEESQRQQGYRSEQENKNHKEPLRQIVMIEPNRTVQSDDKDDLHCRKTIPKMYDKPPLYRSKQKEQQKQTLKEVTPQITTRMPNQNQLLKNIQSIKKKIHQEEESLSLTQNELKSERKTRKPSRKIFKLDIPDTQDRNRKELLEWLISINLLNSGSTKFINQLDSICKDGVVFVQILNYYRGRGKQVSYFKQPKRSAELNSNYQKLFTALSQLPDFTSQLLFQYQYFIPEVQSNAFWHLLSQIHLCFNKRVQPRRSNIDRYVNSIGRKIEKDFSLKKNVTESTSYKQIKYNSNSVKKSIKSNCSSVQMPRRETPTPNRAPSIRNQNSMEKSLAPFGLVQNEEPIEDCNKTERGYKELYLCKFKNIQTPHKNRSFQNTSLSKSRLKISMNSSKKKDSKPLVPSISLDVQMKVLKYIQQFDTEDDIQDLFKDPYRNGVLLCVVVKKYLGVDCVVSRKPKNIQDCRSNFYVAIDLIKSHKKQFNPAYESFVEELLKGQKTLLYGIIGELIRDEERELNRVDSNSFTMNYRNGSEDEGCIAWIRSVQRNYPPIGQYKIRNQASLYSAITGTDFLFHYSWFITCKKAVTPTYQRPVNDIQKESNLKKVLGYLTQSKIIRSDYIWKGRSLLKNQNNIMKDLISDLVSHYNHLFKKQQMKNVNFVKYVRREDSQSRQKYQQKLQTTMANQTLAQPKTPPPPKVEIPWMRRLGFNGSLQLNNGVILCRLLTKLTMKTIQRFNDRPQSRAQGLGNIRRALKLIPKCKWDQNDILECDYHKTLEIYSFLKQKYKHAYAMKGI